MLTNLDWIAPDKPYPPHAERNRLRRYEDNEKLFNGEHAAVFEGDFKRLEEYLLRKRIHLLTVLNYPQLLTKKTADFVCGEPVLVEAGKKKVEALLSALDEMNFDTLLYEAIMDVSRFGDSPIKLMNDRLSIVAPEYWFPIVDETDLKHIVQHVVAFPTKPDEKGNFHEIYVEIHSVGSVEMRRYTASTSTGITSFGTLIGTVTTPTLLDDFAIKVLSNVTHSKSLYGIDDYAIIRPLVEKMMWRLHCMDAVLDKHSDPSLSGPESAMDTDQETGMRYLDLGKYFVRNNKEDPSIEYLTWDGGLDPSFKEMELLLNQTYILSEMGAAFTDGRDHGQISSGTALKLRLVSPRIKAQRIAGINSRTLRQVLGLIAKIKGIALEAKDISVTWNDGLPNDPKEDVEVFGLANGGMPVESQVSTIMRWNDCTEEEAKVMLTQIQIEQAASNPYYGGINDTERKVREEVPPAD